MAKLVDVGAVLEAAPGLRWVRQAWRIRRHWRGKVMCYRRPSDLSRLVFDDEWARVTARGGEGSNGRG